MEKITAEQFDMIGLHGRARTSPFYNEMLKLKPGEGLTILKKEWQRSYAPTKIAGSIARKYGYQFKQGALPDRSGWRVLRVK